MRETVIVEAVRTRGREAKRRAVRHARRRSVRGRPQRTAGARRCRSRDRRRRDLGMRLPGRRPVQQHRPLCGAGRRLAGDHPGDHRQPGVRLQPAGPRLRGARGDVGPARRRRGRRCRGDEPRAARFGQGDRNALRAQSACPLRRLLLQPGPVGGDDRHEVGLLPHPARRILRVSLTSGPPRHRTAAPSPTRLSRCSSTTATIVRRRGRAPRDQRRETGRAEAGVRRGRGDPRGQFLANLRRRGRAAGDHAGDGAAARVDAAGALPGRRGHRSGSGAHAHRPDPGDREGAGQGRRRVVRRSASSR